jgi:hypothetical protein
MVELRGKIVRGYGWATGFLKLQIPLICEEFPEIAKCHRGSINVMLDAPLRIKRPDFVTKKIDWGEQKEVFHFTRIEFQLLPSKRLKNAQPRKFKAWIYGPQNSPHRPNPFHVEVIARKIDLKRAKRCCIRIHRNGRVVPLTILE